MKILTPIQWHVQYDLRQNQKSLVNGPQNRRVFRLVIPRSRLETFITTIFVDEGVDPGFYLYEFVLINNSTTGTIGTTYWSHSSNTRIRFSRFPFFSPTTQIIL